MEGTRRGGASTRRQRTAVGGTGAVLAVAALFLLAASCAPPPPTGGGTTTTGDPTTTIVGAPCPTFPDLSAVEGAGPGYAKPQVTVGCSDTELIVTSNGMPGYTFVPKTPNPLAPQDWHWHVPRAPALAANPTDVSNWFGTIGFTVTGIPIYAAMEGAQPVQEAFGDPVHNGIVDSCKGHTGPRSEYHVHALNPTAACDLDEQLLGYALDGFPIYGSTGCVDLACTEVAAFRSGWVQTGDPTTNAWQHYAYQPSSDPTVLDRCNGRIGPDGTYRYQATDTFPYTVGCFRGTPTTQAGVAAGPMPPMR
jgi:hypothetical protein